MQRVRITVVKRVFHQDLAERYENPIAHACAMNEGDQFVSEEAQRPDGLCDSAWVNLYPYVFALAHGAENFFDGWMKQPKTAVISCNDGIRPVSFLLETITNV